MELKRHHFGPSILKAWKISQLSTQHLWPIQALPAWKVGNYYCLVKRKLCECLILRTFLVIPFKSSFQAHVLLYSNPWLWSLLFIIFSPIGRVVVLFFKFMCLSYFRMCCFHIFLLYPYLLQLFLLIFNNHC